MCFETVTDQKVFTILDLLSEVDSNIIILYRRCIKINPFCFSSRVRYLFKKDEMVSLCILKII